MTTNPTTPTPALASAPTDDAAAFTALFDRHYAAVHRFSTARLGREVGEDVASQVFVVAWRRRLDLDAGRDSALPWLLGIAVNVIREHRRAERRRWAAYGRHASLAVAEPFEQGDVDPRLGAAINALRPGERDVLLLSAWAELTYEEIADSLALPVGTVRSRLNRARNKVRRVLSAEEHLDD